MGTSRVYGHLILAALACAGLFSMWTSHASPNILRVFAASPAGMLASGQAGTSRNAPVGNAPQKSARQHGPSATGGYELMYLLPAKPVMMVDTSLQLTALEYSNSGVITDVTAQADWSSDQANIATVGNSTLTKGLVTAVSDGQALIQVLVNDVPGFANITVVSSMDLPPQALAANASDGRVALAWTALPDSTTFSVMRSSTEGGPYTIIGTTTTPTYTDTGLTDGSSYYYVVSAQYQDNGVSGNSNEAVGTPLEPGAFNVIQHVVYIIKENHSFDSFFGTFPGANGATMGTLSNGRVVQLQHLVDPPPRDIAHDWRAAIWAADGGRMDRFDLIRGGSEHADKLAYSQFYQSDIPNYWSYASAFALGDAMYSSITSGSYPGHLYTMAATNVGVVDNPKSPTAAAGWGCDASADTTAPTITDTQPEQVQAPFPCFSATTLANELQDAGVSWKSYAPSKYAVDYIYNSLRSFNQIFGTPLWHSNVVDESNFVDDAMSSTNMPAVSWLVPDDAADEHPVNSVCQGENWTVAQVNAIMQGPNWNSTVIFIVWDDFGGFYDHVPPPYLDLYGYSIRLPFIIISPYVKQTIYGQQGYITHSTYEFSSVLRFIEERFGVAPLTTRDATANDIMDVFDFSQPPLSPLLLTPRQCP